MTRLAFVIPAWNRHEHLIRCVDSIAQQVDGSDVVIHIVQDGDLAATTASIEYLTKNWPCVKTTRQEPHSDYSAVFRAMFRAEPDADWVWTFGDDDILQPGALKFMLDRLATTEVDFIHIGERKRTSGTNSVYAASSLLDLCYTFGWIEMTGFITANITRGQLLAQAAETPNWRKYAKCSFVQSCILIEHLKDRPAMFLDVPLITSQEQEQTEQTAQVWREQNIPGRYLHVIDAIEHMFEEGILRNKVPAKFFRYLNYHLYDRFITHFISDFLNHGMVWPSEGWGRVARFAQFLADEEEAKRLMLEVEAASGLINLAYYMTKNVEGMRGEIEAIFGRHATAVYPWSYAEAKAAEPTV